MKTLPRSFFGWPDLIITALLMAIGAIIVVLLTSCAQISYTAVKPDGTRVTASAASLFSKNAIKGFNTDSSTEKTTTGLKFSHSETSPELEQLGTLIGAAVKAGK